MEDFLGTIKSYGFHNFDFVGWMVCHGQTLSISEYEVLFTLIETFYGGDGINTFNIPDLRKKNAEGNYYEVGDIMTNGLPYTESYICIDGIYPTRP